MTDCLITNCRIFDGSTISDALSDIAVADGIVRRIAPAGSFAPAEPVNAVFDAKGAIASCANVAPRIAVDIYEKFMAGDHAGALEAQFTLAPLRIATNMGTFPEVIKEGLRMQGIDVGKCVAPIAELTPEEKAKLFAVLQKMGLVK